jgi:RsiW-degrading membrane proteinase PrsW (M82 family)
MTPKRNKLPSVLMLLLSGLGILLSWTVAALLIWSGTGVYAIPESTIAETLILLSIASLSFFMGLMNLPAFVHSIKRLKGKDARVKKGSLFKRASLSLVVWGVLLVIGHLIAQSQTAVLALAPITVLAIILPTWWIIEFARRGLDRPSPFKESSTLTMGLTINPLVIMIVETLLVILVGLVVFIILGLQPGTLTELLEIANSPDLAQGSLENLEELLFNLAQDPMVATALFLIIGVVAPFTEELFKPLAVWFMPKKTATPKDGFILGLISGGAFAFLESVSMVSQINFQDWIISVSMRSATGMLHIGLSGLVGYGIAKAKYEKRWGFALLYLLGAAVLHGLWNSMALLNGYSTSMLPVGDVSMNFGSVATIACMLLVFAAVVFITIKINNTLKHNPQASDEELPG